MTVKGKSRPVDTAKEVFTTGDVAVLCHASPRTVAKWADGGRIPGAYVIPESKDRRVPRAGLVAFLRREGMPVPPGLEPPALLVACQEWPELVGAVIDTRRAWELVDDAFTLGRALATPERWAAVLVDTSFGWPLANAVGDVLKAHGVPGVLLGYEDMTDDMARYWANGGGYSRVLRRPVAASEVASALASLAAGGGA